MTLKAFITQQMIGGAIINAVLNGPIGLLLLQGDTKWPLWGLPSISVDTCAMAFGIAWGTGFLLTPSMRKQIASGKVVLPPLPQSWSIAFSKWPAKAMQRGINLGALALLFFAFPVIAVMAGIDQAPMGRVEVTIYKAVYGLIVGGIFTPLVALGAAADEERARVAPALAETA
jgi:hypothetical protein